MNRLQIVQLLALPLISILFLFALRSHLPFLLSLFPLSLFFFSTKPTVPNLNHCKMVLSIPFFTFYTLLLYVIWFNNQKLKKVRESKKKFVDSTSLHYLVWFVFSRVKRTEQNLPTPIEKQRKSGGIWMFVLERQKIGEINSSRWLRVQAKKIMVNAIKEGIRKQQKWIAEDWQKSKPHAQTCQLYCMQMKGWRGGGRGGPVWEGEREDEIRSDRLFLFWDYELPHCLSFQPQNKTFFS